MTERPVNTLMAGAYKARAVRGKYTQAGYVHGEERQLYIASVPAGSAQDNLRDFNRAGYRGERPWNEAPVPAFEATEFASASAVEGKRTAQRPFIDRLYLQAKRERKDVAACIVLALLIVMLLAAWSQKMIEGVQIQRSINMYQANALIMERENEQLEQKLVLAKGGERIRNLAQNELGMLRPERAETRMIYIQAPEQAAHETVQQNDEPRMELLDILLGLLSVLHIGE